MKKKTVFERECNFNNDNVKEANGHSSWLFADESS